MGGGDRERSDNGCCDGEEEEKVRADGKHRKCWFEMRPARWEVWDKK